MKMNVMLSCNKPLGIIHSFIYREYAAGGELINYIANKGHLSEKEARLFFRQMISAIDHCHSANVVHRDLKLENLLLSSDRTLLISDFGLGRTFKEDQLLRTFCGTPNYGIYFSQYSINHQAAAELVRGIPYEGTKSDIWAMGVVLYIMMTGQPPFKGESISILYSKIKSVTYARPDYFSEALIDLLNKILVNNPAERIDMDSIRKDKWVNIDELELPLRILPRIVGHQATSDLAKNILGVSAQNGMKIYNFIPLTKNIPSKSRSNSIQPMANKNSVYTPLSPTSPRNSLFVPSEVSLGPSARRGSRVSTADFNQKRRGSAFPLSTDVPIAKNEYPDFPSTNHSKIIIENVKSFQLTNDRIPLISAETQLHTLTPLSPQRSNNMTIEIIRPRIRAQSTQVTSFERPKMNVLEKVNDAQTILADSINEFKGLKSKNHLDLDLQLLRENVSVENSRVLTEDDILQWHQIHKPPKEIRTIRWSFNPKMTSHLPPAVIFQHLHRGLDELNKQYYGNLSYKRMIDFYLFECLYDIPNTGDMVIFEVEVSKIWLLKVHGVKMKRTKGDSLVFKVISISSTICIHLI